MDSSLETILNQEKLHQGNTVGCLAQNILRHRHMSTIQRLFGSVTTFDHLHSNLQ